MANAPFVASWSDYLQIKIGAGTLLNLPLSEGSGRTLNYNRRPEMLAQGSAANAFSINDVPGVPVPVYTCRVRCFSNWFTAATLTALLLTRNANGDIESEVDLRMRHAAKVYTDYAKLAMIRLEANYEQQDALDVVLTFVGRNKANATAAAFAAFTAQLGTPFYWGDLDFLVGASTEPYGIERFALNLSLGSQPRKFSGDGEAVTAASHIDTRPLVGAVSIQQRCGADPVLSASSTLEPLTVLVGSSLEIGLELKRDEIGDPVTPAGGAYEITSWGVESITGASPLSISSGV